jgi:hypothetical protein
MQTTQSLTREIAKLRQEIEALKAQQHPMWIEVITDPKLETPVEEQEGAEVASAAQTLQCDPLSLHVVVNEMFYPEPQIMDPEEPILQELKLIKDQTDDRREREAAERRRNDAEFDARNRPEDRPFKITYPKGYLGGV